MADWSKGIEAFQAGSDWRQRYRANKQLETARDQALERGDYSLEGMRDVRKTTNPDVAGVLGADYASGNTDWGGGLKDPFATRLGKWFQERKATKANRKRSVLAIGGGFTSGAPGKEDIAASSEAFAPEMGAMGEIGSIGNPQDDSLDPEAQTFPMEDMADGGSVDLEKLARQQERNARVEIAKQKMRELPGKAREALKGLGDKVSDSMRAPEGAGRMRRVLNSGAAKLGAAAALAGTALTTADTDTEDYRERFGLEPGNIDTNPIADVGVRALGAASDLGSALTFGAADKFYADKQRKAREAEAAGEEQSPEMLAAAPQGGVGSIREYSASSGGGRTALPTQQPEAPVDFSDLDIDPKEVPDMKTNDWVKYRAQMVAAAQKTGDPKAVKEAHEAVTMMQMDGFTNYGMQGLALQQAGNVRGAMAAYRAAFQYFPNGNDVEFGVHRGKDGRQQIVGVGMDEETGKRVPGTEMIMDPERVSVLLKTVTKDPMAYAMWTKDHRDAQFREKVFNEVTKPAAQGQLDYQADMGAAAGIRADRTGAGGGYGQADMRGDAGIFSKRLEDIALDDPKTAQFLMSVMAQVKQRNPNIPPDAIADAIRRAHEDGTLPARLQRMGVGATPPNGGSGGGAPAPAPRQALPISEETGDATDPEMVGLSAEEREWANRPAQ